jgi:hypothetical protein
MTAGLEGLECVEDAGGGGAPPIFCCPAGSRLADFRRGNVVIVTKLGRLSQDLFNAQAIAGLGGGWCPAHYQRLRQLHRALSQGNTGRLVIEAKAVSSVMNAGS